MKRNLLDSEWFVASSLVLLFITSGAAINIESPPSDFIAALGYSLLGYTFYHAKSNFPKNGESL